NLPDVLTQSARYTDTKSAYKLQVHVEQFQGRADGTAIASGTWRLTGRKGHLIARSHFAQSVKLAHNGYPALVTALGKAWQHDCSQIAKTLQKLLASAAVQTTPGE